MLLRLHRWLVGTGESHHRKWHWCLWRNHYSQLHQFPHLSYPDVTRQHSQKCLQNHGYFINDKVLKKYFQNCWSFTFVLSLIGQPEVEMDPTTCVVFLSIKYVATYTSHSHITLLWIKVTSWVGMMFTLQSFILSRFWKSPCLPLYLLARGKSLLKILWNQAAQWWNPSLQTNFARYTFIFLFVILF